MWSPESNAVELVTDVDEVVRWVHPKVLVGSKGRVDGLDDNHLLSRGVRGRVNLISCCGDANEVALIGSTLCLPRRITLGKDPTSNIFAASRCEAPCVVI